MLLDTEAQFLLPTGDSEIQALVDLIIPPWKGKAGGQTAAAKAERRATDERRAQLRATFRVAAHNAENAERWRRSMREANRAREEDRITADRLVAEANARTEAAIEGSKATKDGDRAIMLTLAALVLDANGVPPEAQLLPTNLRLEHLEVTPPQAFFSLGDHPVGIRGLDVYLAGMMVFGTKDGLPKAENAGVYGYLQALAAAGATTEGELARQLTVLVQCGMITGLVGRDGCGTCDACRRLADDLRTVASLKQAVAAYNRKAARPCPDGSN